MVQIVDDDYVLVSWEDADGLASHDDAPAPPLLQPISEIVDGLAEQFWPVNKRIHDHPELKFREHIAHDALTEYMRSRPGWSVRPSAYGMETAWVASYDSGRPGPVVSFNVEMDALPGIGHACGHNLIATASVLGAVAVSELMKQNLISTGKVVAFGTPAEEGGGGKINLLEAGAYSDHRVDISLISHPDASANAALMRTTATHGFKAEYFGREAHAAANPWLGINALDALISAYNNISMLRQQTMPDDIIQGYISNGGRAANIIHAYAAGTFTVRAKNSARLEELKSKVDACFNAGAQATGAKLVITPRRGYKEHIPNRILAQSYTKYFNALDPPDRILVDQDQDEIRGTTKASTDQGDISYAMPSLSPVFSIVPGPNGMGPHNPEFAEAAGTSDAFYRAARVGKALAGVAADILTNQNLLRQVKRKWRDDLADPHKN
ncbi:unnamed protein product [Clonostachys chloroleuca]|uniref:Peptidase M20 domain-containing protein 2 n=1 Tax=Clonostachys chloroleuca TaxID=1926264 RepID=A0AA35M2S8_9HYPO|nr:unnamed protein product [Clonostachys chloroleuca]